jgi:PTS system cellobiose-specific IIB component
MSSGFLAQSARKYVKKNKLDVQIEARSESEVGQFLKKINVLLIGPHYANHLEEFERMASMYDVAVGVIPQKVYAELDGEALVQLALDIRKG